MEPGLIDIHADLIERCRRGEQKAFHDLYKLYSKAMFNIALRIVNDRAEAEDVLQESFVSAFRNLNDFQERSTFGAWLKRIVINKSIGQIKRRRFNLVALDEGTVDIGAEEEVDLAEEELQVGHVRAAIGRLPDGYRIVLSLYLLEGYDHKEVSEILGITESTSKSQFLRARHRLKSILKEEFKYA